MMEKKVKGVQYTATPITGSGGEPGGQVLHADRLSARQGEHAQDPTIHRNT